MRKLISVGVLLFLSSVAAQAATTIDGSYSITYSAAHGNVPSISDDLSKNFSEVLTQGTTTAVTSFYTVTPAGSCGSGCISDKASGTISVSFTFSSPTIANGTATAVYMANYSNDTDSVSWNSSPLVVDFTDGAVLDINLVNASDWAITPKIDFDLVQGPTPVPEPATISVAGAGLLGLTALMMRRRRKLALNRA